MQIIADMLHSTLTLFCSQIIITFIMKSCSVCRLGPTCCSSRTKLDSMVKQKRPPELQEAEIYSLDGCIPEIPTVPSTTEDQELYLENSWARSAKCCDTDWATWPIMCLAEAFSVLETLPFLRPEDRSLVLTGQYFWANCKVSLEIVRVAGHFKVKNDFECLIDSSMGACCQGKRSVWSFCPCRACSSDRTGVDKGWRRWRRHKEFEELQNSNYVIIVHVYLRVLVLWEHRDAEENWHRVD